MRLFQLTTTNSCSNKSGKVLGAGSERFDPGDREKMTALIRNLSRPVIHYKIMAAGRNDPREAFAYAARAMRPTDAVCVGVYPAAPPLRARAGHRLANGRAGDARTVAVRPHNSFGYRPRAPEAIQPRPRSRESFVTYAPGTKHGPCCHSGEQANQVRDSIKGPAELSAGRAIRLGADADTVLGVQCEMMTSKERLMRALRREKPDRLPVTVHQWQSYHLGKYMGGMDALSAFKATGMDASIQYFALMGQFWIPNAELYAVQTTEWRETIAVIASNLDNRLLHHTITTPEGELTYNTGSDSTTTWITEYLIKRDEDVELIAKYMPVPRLDQKEVSRVYDAVGDAGIVRGFVWGDQAGCWQHACCLMGVQELIMQAYDNPDWVHRLLSVLLEKKLRFVEESLAGARFDVVETGGGAGSDTVISPAFHREFCLPYDRAMHRALHRVGHISTYHTCGGMMHILDLIAENETDASETLAPPGVGGNITDPGLVRARFGGKIAMIGGMDQFNILTQGSPAQVRAEVHRLFQGFGKDGGYILSTSDHFFETPVANLRAFAAAAQEYAYA